MTEAPPQQPRRQRQSRRAEYAAAITLIASSNAPQATKSAEIADILLRAAMDAATIPAEAAAKVAKALAELVVVQRILDRRRGRERGTQRPEGGGSGISGAPGIGKREQPVQRGLEVRPQRVEEDELLRRSLYVVNGSMRMSRDIAKGMDPMEALERESRHFLSHTEMQQKRRTAKRLRAVAVEEHGPLLGWRHGDPKEPRILHLQADGLNFRADGSAPKATGGDFPGEKPGCVIEGTPVEAQGVLAAFRRLYEGEIVEITTDLGSKLRVTPNHPILTSEGWIGADSLVKGDDVVGGCLGEQMVGMAMTNHHYRQSTAEQVFESLWRSVGSWHTTIATTGEDFHGDGMQADVDVIGTPRLLLHALNAASGEPVRQDGLGLGDMQLPLLARDSGLAGFVEGARAASHSGVGISGSTLSPFKRALLNDELRSFANVSDFHSSFFEAAANGGALDPERLGDRVFGFPTKIPLLDVLNRQIHTASGGPHQSALMEDFVQPLSVDTRTFGGVVVPESVNVELHRVLKVRARSFVGHVYNFQTEDQMYMSDCIVTHNCTCVAVAPFPGAMVME